VAKQSEVWWSSELHEEGSYTDISEMQNKFSDFSRRKVEILKTDKQPTQIEVSLIPHSENCTWNDFSSELKY